MYFVTIDKTTRRLEIWSAEPAKADIVGRFSTFTQAQEFVAGASSRVAEFKREVADARHHLNKQLAVLAQHIKKQEG